jgi:hydrogenase expression/formation protein HypC
MTRHPTVRRSPDPAPRNGPECHDEVCVTCSDQAERRSVVELRPGGLALVETATGREEISVALVEARVGDLVLVHAKEAIGVIPTRDQEAGS